ncbi:uncharacterized protein B0P05DRAFT_527110 [Gilbertella persicaria]|uniref:Elongator subunit elp6 n=1 Tax=Rhizopus stolonifer TaxID=4846 RepID=A0A367KWT1_RHIST|nr:uncharacterized protein B0P05DRAFT_527110 [Gilbertella persicaria]KAI8091353.1 hypothetical protein B0P05DRAFT_527110 [Gilbertella persicaria]RCI06651.1 Elongator subunit elp6 [Rhizopus stolonifer]
MGYATLDAALAFPNNLPPQQAHIAITDTLKSDANFLIHHFIVNHLKNDKPVVLVGFSQIFNHYFLIARKLGINLQTYKQSGKFVFIDGLTHFNPYTPQTPYPPTKAPTAPTATLEYNQDPKSFYETIASHVQPNALIVLDDISTWIYNGMDHAALLLKLKALTERVQGTLLTIMHADEEGTEDMEQDNFVKQVLYGSSLILQVQPLHSGLARDVHGQLDIIYGPQSTVMIEKHTPPQSMHYKILDNNVHFFAKGIAQI